MGASSQSPSQAWDGSAGTDEEETMAGTVPYVDVLQRLHTALRPAQYLEIGVRHGTSLALATGEATGVDPAPELHRDLPDTTRIVVLTSDAYFASSEQGPPPDFCFIDGMHLSEFALRDFMNVERCAAPGAVVVFDDIFPRHPAQAERQRRTRNWTGDVWRITEILRRHRPDLFVAEIDVFPAGLLVVAGLDPGNRRLDEVYESLALDTSPAPEPPRRVTDREGALDPTSGAFDHFVETLAECRAARASARDTVRALSRPLDGSTPSARPNG